MNLLQRYLRWLIMRGVRAEVYPDTKVFKTQLEQYQTVYVLADRGLSDLLILSEICQQHQLPDPFAKNEIPSLSNHHSVYGIASRSPMIDWLKNRSKQSELLDDLIMAVKENQLLSLRLVPVSVYWGRPLARQKHWLQVLFADRWAVAGRTRRFFTWMIHGRNTRIILSEPVDAANLFKICHYDSSAIHTQLLELLTQQRQATFGPQITSHKILTNEVLNADNIRQHIIELEQSDSISVKKLQRKAKQYCNEIFANCTQITIELMLRLLRQFWRRFYSGIDVHNIAPIQEIALSHQLVYVPCHRSHVDYLLLSYVIFNENLAIPYIAAGSNLNVPIIGRILRGGGAFFIRRSFKDNRLYSAIMRQYLQQLVDLGVPLEYFIEGGRSRTGRLLTPKLGMLEMTISAYIKTQKRPIAFVPVYIGYEKLIEGQSYLGELSGAKKKGESLLGTLTAIFRLSGRFGRVTASFGKPIDLNNILDKHQTDWRDRAENIDEKPDWYKSAILQLSRTVMFSINRACIVNPVNLSALVLLATPRQSIDLTEMVEQANLLSRLITNRAITAAVTVSGRVDADQINQLASQKMLVVRKHIMGDIVHLTPENAVLMSYYRNNCLHGVILPALLACCFVNSRKIGSSKPVRLLKILYPFLREELQLEWDEKSFAENLAIYIDQFIELGLLKKVGNSLQRPDRSDRQYLPLIRIAQIVQPILERYYMTFVVLWQSSSHPLTESEVEQQCHLLAQKISMVYGINSPDFFDRALFHHFLETMRKKNYLTINENEKLEFTEYFDHISLDLRNLLSVEVRSSILSLTRDNLPASPDQ